MGKKSYAQRAYDKRIGEVEANPNAPVKVSDNPLDVLKDIKKEQLMVYYHQKLGIPLFILNIIWEHLEKMPEHKIKQLKKGNIKNIIKRKTYKEGETIRAGYVYDENKNLVKEKVIEEKINDDEILTLS